jgi:hypothetical protein
VTELGPPVDVRILRHQAEPFRHIMAGKPSTTCLVWGRGLGKSFFARLIMWLMIAQWYGKKRKTIDGEMSGIRIYMLMPTLKQFKQVHGALLEEENRTKWAFLGGKLNKTDWSLSFPDGSFFIPVPGETATSERGRGFRGDITIFDEADDIEKSIRHGITQPWFSENWSLGIEILCGTPKRGRYGLLYEMFERGQSKDPEFADIVSWRAKSEDYPEVFNPRQLKKARAELPPPVYAREYEADFDSAEGLVYAFDESIHVAEPPDTRFFTEFFVCGDHGMQDPGVILLCGLQGRGNDSTLWVLDEVYASNKPNHEWDQIARERFQGLDGYFDPSRPDRIIDYRRAGIKCKDVDNSIEAGVARVADLLVVHHSEPAKPDEPVVTWTRLKVAPRCVNTRWEFVNYRRKKDPRNPDHYLEDIVDKNNHAMDSLRYGAMGRFGPVSSRGNYRHEAPGR